MSKKKSAEAKAARAARAQALIEERRKDEQRRRFFVVGGIVAAVVVIGVLAWFLAMQDDSGEATDQQSTPTSQAIDEYAVVVGDAEAPATVTLYEDLQCPACAQLEAAVGDQLSQAIDDGSVKVEYRMISFLDNASTNEYSSRAMNAALVVLQEAGVDSFREFHDILFARQPAEGGAGYTDDELVELAVEAGAEESAVRPGIEDKVFDQWITNATDQSSKDGVNGTPTVEVDGERVEGDPVQAITDAVTGQ